MDGGNYQAADSDSESEWEYEYHDTETEDVYITLDFAADQEPGKPPRKLTDSIFENGKSSPKPKKRRRKATEEEEDPDWTNADTGQDHVEDDDASNADEWIQILGLQSNNPILSFNDTSYSCHWAQPLGTDMFFAKAPSAPDIGEALDNDDTLDTGDENQSVKTTHRPLRTFQKYDLLGLGAARLIAMPTDIHLLPAPRSYIPENLKITLEPEAEEWERRQAGFLEQLNAIKKRRNEPDRVAAGGKPGIRKTAGRGPQKAKDTRVGISRASQQGLDFDLQAVLTHGVQVPNRNRGGRSRRGWNIPPKGTTGSGREPTTDMSPISASIQEPLDATLTSLQPETSSNFAPMAVTSENVSTPTPTSFQNLQSAASLDVPVTGSSQRDSRSSNDGLSSRGIGSGRGRRRGRRRGI